MNNINKLKILIVGLTAVLQFSNSNKSVIHKGIVMNTVSEINISILQSDNSESIKKLPEYDIKLKFKDL